MKVNDFVTKAEAVYKMQTMYQLGKFLNSKSGSSYLADCSGLVKGILWGYPENGKYASNSVPDINANTIISKCSLVSTDFTNIKKGEVVWMNEHIGIYVGDGHVIEATAAWDNKVMKTNLANINGTGCTHSRKWIKHGFLPYVDYNESQTIQFVYTGVSLVDYLESIGVDSSFTNRAKLASANGISPYSGTAAQNTALLNKLRGTSNVVVNETRTVYYKKYTGTSVSLVDILKALGVDSSYTNRVKIAKANGITGYNGSRVQNSQLVNLAKSGKLKVA